MDFCSDFRHDLKIGQLAEKALADIIENKTVEVKNDLKASKTGNLFIEYHSRGKPKWYQYYRSRLLVLCNR